MKMVAAGWLAEGLDKGLRKREGPGFLQIQGLSNDQINEGFTHKGKKQA